MPNFKAWLDTDELQGEELIFPKVEKLHIRECKSLIALPKATSVVMKSSSGVHTKCRSAFPTLREMSLDCLGMFERWEAVKGPPEEEVTFPLMEVLSVHGCPKLTDLPVAPQLSKLIIDGDGQQMSLQAASIYIPSLSSLSLAVSPDDTETTLQHVRQEWNHELPLAAMRLTRCNLLLCSHSSALALWTCFAQLVDLTISDCDALVYWPENVFQALVSLRDLSIWRCSKLTGLTEDSDQQSAPAPEQGGLLTRLESLWIDDCTSLVVFPKMPASLKTLHIECCSNNVESILFGQQEDTRLMSGEGVVWLDTSSSIPGSSSNEATASTAVLKLSSAAKHPFVPCLEFLTIENCDGLSQVANLPPSIKTLTIRGCSNLQSLSGQLDALQELTVCSCQRLKSLKCLESCLGEHPSLEQLWLYRCKSLVSLPDGPQPYSSLRRLQIYECDGIKLLPRSLQRRLDYLEVKRLDARYEGNLQFFLFF
jgi:hypothetical protein